MLLLRPVGNVFCLSLSRPSCCGFFPGIVSLCPALRFFKRGGDVPQPMLHRNNKSVSFWGSLLRALDRRRARAGAIDGIGQAIERQRREFFAATCALFAAKDETAGILAEPVPGATPT